MKVSSARVPLNGVQIWLCSLMSILLGNGSLPSVPNRSSRRRVEPGKFSEKENWKHG